MRFGCTITLLCLFTFAVAPAAFGKGKSPSPHIHRSQSLGQIITEKDGRRADQLPGHLIEHRRCKILLRSKSNACFK